MLCHATYPTCLTMVQLYQQASCTLIVKEACLAWYCIVSVCAQLHQACQSSSNMLYAWLQFWRWQPLYSRYITMYTLFAAPSSSMPGQPKAEAPKLEAPKAPQLPKIESPKLAPKPPSLPTPPQPNALPQQDGELPSWPPAISSKGS